MKWPDVLLSTLDKIGSDAKLAEQEMGLSTLFLVFGFLEWTDSKDSTKRLHAPLLLLPVQLERTKSARGKISYSLSAIAAAPDNNLSLTKKLETQDVLLPEFEHEETSKAPLEAYFAGVEESIKDKSNWRVRRWLTLGHFAFGRLAMYTDLAPDKWGNSPVQKDLVKSVLRGSEMTGDGGAGLSRPPEDHQVDLPEVELKAPYLVHDADASQHSAIIDVMGGQNLVIQGPPGTGKSQTIANIIANAMGVGKTVLFLAEKMAALEVVKRRLDRVGLGHFCLELHSHKSSPKSVIASLKERHELGYSPHRDRIAGDGTWAEARRQIGRYLAALHTDTEVGKPFDQFWRAIRVRSEQGKHLPSFRKLALPDNVMTSPAAAEEIMGRLDHFAATRVEFEKTFGPVASSAWSRLSFPPEANAGMAYGLIDKLETLLASARELQSACQTAIPKAIETVEEIEAAAQIDRSLPPEAPSGGAISLLSKIDAAEAVALVALLDDIREKAAQLEFIAGLELSSESLIATATAALVTLSVLQKDQKPEQTFHEAQRTVSESARLMSAIDIALPAVAALPLGDDFPASGLSILRLVAMYLRSAPLATRELAFGGARISIDAMQALAREWRNLISEEQRWRTRFSAHTDTWPAADNLLAAAVVRRKTGLGRLLSGFGSDAKTTVAVNASLGVLPSVEISAEDLEGLAAHTRAVAAFHANRNHSQLVRQLWDGLDTKVDDIIRDLEIAAKLQAVLPGVPGGAVVKSMLDDAAPGLMEKLEALYDPLVPWSKLDQNVRALVDDASLTEVTRHLADKRSAADKILALDPHGALGRIDGTWAQIEAAIARLAQHREAVERAARHPLASLQSDILAHRNDLPAVMAWLEAVRAVPMDDDLRAKLSTGDAPRVRKELARSIGVVQGALHIVTKQMEEITQVYGVEGSDFVRPQDLLSLMEDLVMRRDELSQFLAVSSAFKELEALGLGDHLSMADEVGVDASMLPALLRGVLAQNRAEQIRRKDPVLSSATGAQIEARRNDFARRDRIKKEQDRKQVFNAVVGNPPLPGSNYGPKKTWTEGQALRKEFGKERRLVPVRELITQAGHSLQAMKPCFMMSPLSLAKFVPAKSLTFDLLVIDEASQMRPEDALGGLLRADQVVVVGDPKQLPPSDFFQRAAITSDGGDDGVDGDGEDDESILEACHKTFQQLRLLRWHYRSRCESLIAFSNREIYAPEGRRLITFPASRAKSFSIDRIRVRGHFEAHCNPTEAQRIAQEAVRFMREHADLEKPPTLGIVAMNGPQTDFIIEELRHLTAGDEAVDRYRAKLEALQEPFFVKNLENVQGDERDYILISMTYGPRPNENSVLQRFGPITNKQGHRRLNVLFTRARVRIGLVTSMDSSDIRPSETSSAGVHMLQRYLAYVEQGGREPGTLTGREPDSDFELHVAERLRARGFEVVYQVGVSGFRIDLGVLHPKHEGHFLAGVECDGAQYHSSKSARDRDRLRQEVLEGLGWRLLRVWSTDWFDNPDRQANILVEKLQSLADHPLNVVKEFGFTDLLDTAHLPIPAPPTNDGMQAALEFVFAEGDTGDTPPAKAVADARPLDQSDVKQEAHSEPWKNSIFTRAEAKSALAAFREQVIAPTIEQWEAERSILRSGLIETFVEQRVVDDSDWFTKVPNYLRRNTNPLEKRLFFEDICDLISRIR